MIFRIIDDFENIAIITDVAVVTTTENKVLFTRSDNGYIARKFKNNEQAIKCVNDIYERIEAQHFRGTPMIDVIEIEKSIKGEKNE